MQPHHGVQIVIVMLLLSRLVGWQASVGGFVTSLLLVPVTAALMRRVAAVRKRLAPLTDARVKLCSETVAGEEVLYARGRALRHWIRLASRSFRIGDN